MSGRPSALVVDDHPVVLRGVRELLRSCGEYEDVATATSGAQAVERAEALQPGMTLLDIRVGNVLAPDLCGRLRAVAPGTVVAVFTAHDDRPLLQACLDAGARGIVLKDTLEVDLLDMLRRIRAGEVALDSRVRDLAVPGDDPVIRTPGGEVFERLTRREYEVLRLLASGNTTAQIAAELFLAPNTVRSYLQSILAKLKANSRVQALATARRLRMI